MAKYILTKRVKGKKFEYQVLDTESKSIVSSRTSTRDYVACTANGQFYFGRLDLIGKGDHGKRLSYAAAFLANPEKAYKDWLAYFVPTERIKQKESLPYEKFILERKPWYEKEKEELNTIAYL
jgi:hypothetical protein